MKRRFWAAALLLPLLLSGCGKNTFDPQTVAQRYADGSLTTEYIVTTHAGFYTEYRLSSVTEGGLTTVTILQPESVAGVTALLQSGQATMQYEEMSLDALLPAVAGCSPMDMLHQLLEDLKKELPVSSCVENGTVTLDYQRTLPDGTELRKQVVLGEETLDVLSAEVYLDGDLLLALQADTFQWKAAG